MEVEHGSILTSHYSLATNKYYSDILMLAGLQLTTGCVNTEYRPCKQNRHFHTVLSLL